VLILALWLACSGPGCVRDPDTRARREAAEAWDRGMDARRAGHLDDAEAAFHKAADLDPDSPVLPTWRAQVLAEQGRVPEALAVLDEALSRFPADTTLRFNRAGLRARQGELDDAAADLHQLLSSGAIQPEDAGVDPDLALLRERPDLALLAPIPSADITAFGPDGSVLLGDRATVQVQVDAPAGVPLLLQDMGEPSGLLRRERVVQTDLDARPGRVRIRLDLSLLAVGEGPVSDGPWLLTAGATSGLTDRMRFDILAVGDRSGSVGEARAEDLVLPSVVLAGHSPPWAGRVGEVLVIMAPPGATAELEGPAGPVRALETWELRDDTQPRWSAWLYPDPGTGRAHVRRGRQDLLDQVVAPASPP